MKNLLFSSKRQVLGIPTYIFEVYETDFGLVAEIADREGEITMRLDDAEIDKLADVLSEYQRKRDYGEDDLDELNESNRI